MERNLTLIFGGMLLVSSFMVIGQTPENYTGQMTNLVITSSPKESLPSISTEKRGLVGKVRGITRKNKQDDICLTSGCVKAAASVINDMDPSVNPCDDFYQFACGNFIKTNFVNHDKTKIGVLNKFSEIENLLSNKLDMILSEPIHPNEQKPFKLMKLLFKSCMDEDSIKKKGLMPIKKILKSHGGWPVLEAENWNETDFTWKDSVYKFRKSGLGINSFITCSVRPDFENTTRNAILLQQPTLGLNQEALANGTQNKNVDAYYKYMVDTAVLYGADRKRATEELRKSLDFQIGLVRISTSKTNQVLVRMNVTDLQKSYPRIPWQEYFNNLLDPLSIRQDDIVIVHSLEYFSGLQTLLNNTPKRVQANYVMWRVAEEFADDLTEELIKLKQEYNSKLSERDEIKLRWKKCVDVTSGYFPLALGSLYVRRFFHQNAKQNALEMVNGIREEMHKLIKATDWMDNETKKKAIEKAKSVTNHIAYPDELLDDSKLNAYYEKLEVNDDDYLTLKLKYNKFKTDHMLWQFKQVNKSAWVTHSETTLVNAQYKPQENSILVPAGILQGALFSNDRPRYMNYGSIGFVIGHEITHGLDNQGKEFDKDGNLVNWWMEKTKNRFMEKASCLIKQYGNYTAQEVDLKLDGTNTLSENIADNGGVKEAYNAYKAWVRKNGVEPRLPGLQKYTPQQMFWLSAANIWCAKYRPSTLKYLIHHDTHTPNRFRVFGTFSNMKDFSNDFRCPLGSNMNPVHKCQVW